MCQWWVECCGLGKLLVYSGFQNLIIIISKLNWIDISICPLSCCVVSGHTYWCQNMPLTLVAECQKLVFSTFFKKNLYMCVCVSSEIISSCFFVFFFSAVIAVSFVSKKLLVLKNPRPIKYTVLFDASFLACVLIGILVELIQSSSFENGSPK